VSVFLDGVLLAASSDGALWSVSGDVLVRQLDGHASHVDAISFSPDGQRLLSCGGDTVARVWRVATGEEVRHPEGHTWWIWAVAFAPHGVHAATAGRDQAVFLWSTASWSAKHPLRFGSSVSGMLFPPES
jgi:WD40 repeat protein